MFQGLFTDFAVDRFKDLSIVTDKLYNFEELVIFFVESSSVDVKVCVYVTN